MSGNRRRERMRRIIAGARGDDHAIGVEGTEETETRSPRSRGDTGAGGRPDHQGPDVCLQSQASTCSSSGCVAGTSN